MSSTFWNLVQSPPVFMVMVLLWGCIVVCFIKSLTSRCTIFEEKLERVTIRYDRERLKAETYKNEIEDLAARVKEENDG